MDTARSLMFENDREHQQIHGSQQLQFINHIIKLRISIRYNNFRLKYKYVFNLKGEKTKEDAILF